MGAMSGEGGGNAAVISMLEEQSYEATITAKSWTPLGQGTILASFLSWCVGLVLLSLRATRVV